jgi:sigma-B regulation protein RsbU (phosphoserine phosphatase)
MSAEALAPIVEPYGEADAGLEVTVESADGRVLATAGTSPRHGGPDGPDGPMPADAARDIRSEGSIIGRLTVRGNAAPLVEAVATSLAGALEALVAASGGHRQVDADAHRLEAELALGRRIQRSFVPLVLPEIKGYEVASHYEAAREVGGDFFDVFRLRDRTGRLAVVIADVTGKGIAAALLMAFARPLLHAAIDHARTPAEALRRTNRILVEERRSSLFITALCLIVELRNGRIRLANAGHEPPLVVPADGPVRWLPGAGPLLGAFEPLDLDECADELAPGDIALLYTDGVTDSRAATGEWFGEDRLLEVVERERGGTARELVDGIVAAIVAFQGDMPPADDVTIVAIRRDEAKPGRLGRLRR